jgi:hypothetical protein
MPKSAIDLSMPKSAIDLSIPKRAIRLTPRFANELYITKKRSPFPFKREFDLLALNQWVSRSPILLNRHRSPFSSLTKIPIAANLKDAIID